LWPKFAFQNASRSAALSDHAGKIAWGFHEYRQHRSWIRRPGWFASGREFLAAKPWLMSLPGGRAWHVLEGDGRGVAGRCGLATKPGAAMQAHGQGGAAGGGNYGRGIPFAGAAGMASVSTCGTGRAGQKARRR